MQNRYNYVFIFFFIATYFYGIFNLLSPIPVQDSWDQIYHFLNHKTEISNWISLHNEHLIYTARIFYYLNNLIFNAHPYGLILLNNLFVILGLYLFVIIFKKVNLIKGEETSRFYSLIFILPFFWSQKSNFIWDVQAQQIYTQVFALVLFILHFYINYKKLYKFIPFVFLLLFFELGAMANGVISALMLILISLLDIKKINKIYFFGLLILTLCAVIIYYLQIENVVKNNLNIIYFFKHFFAFFGFFLSLLGSVLGFILGKSIYAMVIAGSLTLVVIICLLKVIIKMINKKETHNYEYISLILFCIFLIVTSILISFGRADSESMKSAFSGRYSTVSIYFWLSIYIIFFKDIKKYINTIIFYVLIFLLALYQITAYKDSSSKILERECAFIELYLINNPKDYEKLYPDKNRLLEIFSASLSENYMIFEVYKKYLSSNTELKNLFSFNNITNFELNDVHENFQKISFSAALKIKEQLQGKGFLKLIENNQVIGFFKAKKINGNKYNLCGYAQNKKITQSDLIDLKFESYEPAI